MIKKVWVAEHEDEIKIKTSEPREYDTYLDIEHEYHVETVVVEWKTAMLIMED